MESNKNNIIYSAEFKKWFGDWELLAKAKLLGDNIKGILKSSFKGNEEEFLFEMSIQANNSESERRGAIKVAGEELISFALKLYPNSKIGDKFFPAVSKVVDKDGKPLVVYHGFMYNYGAEKKFNEFKRLPAFFSESRAFAESYAETKSMDGGLDADIDSYACFLNIKNLFDPNNKSVIELANKELPKKINVSHGTMWFLDADLDKEDVVEQLSGIVTIYPDQMTDDILKANVGDVIPEKISMSQHENRMLIYKDENLAYTVNERDFDEKMEWVVADYINSTSFSLSSNGRKEIKYNGKTFEPYILDEKTYRMKLNEDPIAVEFFDKVVNIKKYYIDNINTLPKEDEDKRYFTIRLKNTKSSYDKTLYIKKRNLTSYKTKARDNWNMFENETVQKFLTENGFGGWISFERGDKTYAVYNANDIKLADGTNTTFDGSNTDIRFNDGGIIKFNEGGLITTENITPLIREKASQSYKTEIQKFIDFDVENDTLIKAHYDKIKYAIDNYLKLFSKKSSGDFIVDLLKSEGIEQKSIHNIGKEYGTTIQIKYTEYNRYISDGKDYYESTILIQLVESYGNFKKEYIPLMNKYEKAVYDYQKIPDPLAPIEKEVKHKLKQIKLKITKRQERTEEQKREDEIKKLYQQAYNLMPSINKDVLTKMLKDIELSFKPMEDKIYEREMIRYNDLIKSYIVEVKAEIIREQIPFWREIFSSWEDVVKKVKGKVYNWRIRLNEDGIIDVPYYKNLKLKSDYEKVLDREITYYIFNLRLKFLLSVFGNFEKINIPIKNYKLIQLEVGAKGFQGLILFNFENGSKFTFKTEAIGAGGYNIQKYHFRYLSDFTDVILSDGKKLTNPPLWEILQKFSVNGGDVRFDEGGEINICAMNYELNKNEFVLGGKIPITHYKKEEIIGKKFKQVFPSPINRSTPAQYRIVLKSYYSAMKRLEENNYKRINERTYDERIVKYYNTFLNDIKYMAGLRIDNTGTVVEVDENYEKLSNGGVVEQQTKKISPTVNEMGFYSPIEKRILEFKQDRASTNKWKDIIGTKSDEAIYTGLTEYLDTKKPDEQVLKIDVLNFIRDNSLEFIEVVKGDIKNIQEKDIKKVSFNQFASGSWEIDFGGDIGVIGINANEVDDEAEAIQSALDKVNYDNIEKRKSKTKYSKHVLSGESKNYTEVLIMMPDEAQKNRLFYNKLFHALSDSVKERVGIKSDTFEWNTFNLYDYKNSGILTENELHQLNYIDSLSHKSIQTFTSSHWDEKNILVHLRYDIRTDANGYKVLFVSEIQSDWGQKAKREGFKTNDGKNLVEFREEMKRKYGHSWYSDRTDEEVATDNMLIKGVNGVPTAPFVTDTNKWVKLGLKVLLQHAVKNNANKFAWMTGEQENDLYDLGKQLSKISWWQVGDDEQGYGITTYDKSNQMVLKERDIDLKQIEKLVGKDVAERIKNKVGLTDNMGQTTYGELTDDDLKLSSSGMIGFYGSIIQGKEGIVGSVLKSLVKELTGKTTEIIESEIETLDINVLKQPSREITVENTYVEKLQNKYLLKSKVDNKILSDGSLSWRDNFYSNEDHHADLVNSANKYPIDFGKKTSTQPSIDINSQLQESIEQGIPMFKKGGSINPFSICTVSIGHTAGTQKRSEWNAAQLHKYESCILKVKDKMAKGGGLFTFLYIDNNGKHIVYENKDGYVIAVNDPDNAKYITLWYNDERVGVLEARDNYLNDYHGRYTGKFLSVQSIYIDEEHRDKKFGLKLYKVLQEFSATDVIGFFSELKNRQNKKIIPKIYNHFNNEIVEDYHIVTYADGGIVSQIVYFAIFAIEEDEENWYMVAKYDIDKQDEIDTVIRLVDKATEDGLKVKAITQKQYDDYDLGDEITINESTEFYKEKENDEHDEKELKEGGSISKNKSCKFKFRDNKVPSKGIYDELFVKK